MCKECYKPPALTQIREKQREDRALGRKAESLEKGDAHAFQPAGLPATGCAEKNGEEENLEEL